MELFNNKNIQIDDFKQHQHHHDNGVDVLEICRGSKTTITTISINTMILLVFLQHIRLSPIITNIQKSAGEYLLFSSTTINIIINMNDNNCNGKTKMILILMVYGIATKIYFNTTSQNDHIYKKVDTFYSKFQMTMMMIKK